MAASSTLVGTAGHAVKGVAPSSFGFVYCFKHLVHSGTPVVVQSVSDIHGIGLGFPPASASARGRGLLSLASTGLTVVACPN